MSELRILLVDDQPEVRELIKDFITTEYPYVDITCACNGHEALVELRQNDGFDLLITDYDMPVIDGMELVRSLKSLSEQQRPGGVIILSAYLEAGEPPSDVQYVTYIVKDEYRESLKNYISNKLYLKTRHSTTTTQRQVVKNEKRRVDIIADGITEFAILKDISETGMALFVSQLLPEFAVGRFIECILSTSSGQYIKLNCKIIHQGSESQYYIGLKIIEVSEKNKALLLNYLHIA